MSNNLTDRLEVLGYASYKEYLNSELWAGIRENALTKHGSLCLVCGEPAQVVHHNDYFMATMTGEDLDGLVPMCRFCHDKIEMRGSTKRTSRQVRGILLGYMWAHFHRCKRRDGVAYCHPVLQKSRRR